MLELGTLLGPVAGELVERLRSARTWTDRFLELDTVLARIAGTRDGPAPEFGWAWRRLSASHGRAGVAALAREIGWSRRHLSERFRREFGLTPKVAARAGYYDQAYLHREWRELAGCTPTRWLAGEFPSVHDSHGEAEHPQ
ncbi:MAG TPA: hypothetical protein VFO16_17980 [Pseudonocardiaceae bacterium]|nr:hypothetical protein [Pseudonocardiaceae bacterium]